MRSHAPVTSSLPRRGLAPFALLAAAACTPAAEAPPGSPTPPKPLTTATAAGSTTGTAAAHARPFPYPEARTVDASDRFQSTVVPDPYRWLEDGDAPDVKAWVAAEDALAASTLAALPERAGFVTRLTALRYIDALGAPRVEGKRFFQSRRTGAMEKAALFVRDRDDAKAALRPAIDPNGWPAAPPMSLQSWVPSPDGKRVAYETALNNADENVLDIMDVASGKVEDHFEGLLGATLGWAAKGDAFYYVWVPTDSKLSEAERFAGADLRRHVLGTKQASDTLVRPTVGTAGDYEMAAESRDGHWLIVHRQRGASRQSVYLRRADRPKDPWIALADGDALATAFAHKDKVYLVTNEGAPHFRLVRVDAVKATAPTGNKGGRRASEKGDTAGTAVRHAPAETFTTVVAERADAILDLALIVGGRLVLVWMIDASQHLEVRDLDGTNPREVALPTATVISEVTGREDSPAAHLVLSSIAQPPELWALDTATAKLALVERPKSGVDPERYVSEQIFAKSKDGTRVPAFVARRRDTPKDGARPTIVDGYGGFGLSRRPKFEANAVAWMDKGGVWITAGLRGGSEYGEDWHTAGKLTRKQNVFDDYFAVAEEAVRAGFTRPGRLAALGRSNGGLLVGAAVTQRPDLWGAALCGVPLLDMVRMRLTGNGASWVEEYGSPDDPAELAALLAYSPYHNVVPGKAYPPLLVASSDADERVDPMHARKFVARMQAAGSGGPILLRVESDAGHMGGDGVKKGIERFGDQLSFLWHHASREDAK